MTENIHGNHATILVLHFFLVIFALYILMYMFDGYHQVKAEMQHPMMQQPGQSYAQT
jgi:hypothetical protein